MKMIIKMLPDEKMNEDSDSAKFWSKVELPDGKTGFLASEVKIDENDKVTFICPRLNNGSFLRLFPPKPLSKGTIISMAFQDENFFELWSSEIIEYSGGNNGFDEYEISSIQQEMNTSDRKANRFLVSIPLKIEINSKFPRVLRFSGCELSTNGIGVWLPNSSQNKIEMGQTYKLTFEPKEVEPFSFEIECVRPHCSDSFSKGVTAGFALRNVDENSLEFLRLNQLLEALGKINEPNLHSTGHYLSQFWGGEFFGEMPAKTV